LHRRAPKRGAGIGGRAETGHDHSAQPSLQLALGRIDEAGCQARPAIFYAEAADETVAIEPVTCGSAWPTELRRSVSIK
jgi:hypothetical protein